MDLTSLIAASIAWGLKEVGKGILANTVPDLLARKSLIPGPPQHALHSAPRQARNVPRATRAAAKSHTDRGVIFRRR